MNISFGISLPGLIQTSTEKAVGRKSPCTWAGHVSPEQQWEQQGSIVSHVTEDRIKIIL